MSAEMKINWDVTLTNFDGKLVKKTSDLDSEPATLRFLVCQSLELQFQDDKPELKEDRGELIERILDDAANQSFKPSEMTLMRERLKRTYSPWIGRRCVKLLEATNGEMPKAE